MPRVSDGFWIRELKEGICTVLVVACSEDAILGHMAYLPQLLKGRTIENDV